MGAVITGVSKSRRADIACPPGAEAGHDDREAVRRRGRSSSKGDVLNAVGRLAARVRSGLGDTISQSGSGQRQRNLYGQLARSGLGLRARARTCSPRASPSRRWRPAGGRRARSESGARVFGHGRRRQQPAAPRRRDRVYDTALSQIDRMTERERFRTRGRITRRWACRRGARRERSADQAVPLRCGGVEQPRAGLLPHVQFSARAGARTAGRLDLSGNVLRQSNVALYALYASDFPTAATQAEHVLALNKDYPRGHLVLALAHLANGEVEPAIERYRTLGTLPAAREFSAHGLADVARYRGRLAEAATAISRRPSRRRPPRRRARA